MWLSQRICIWKRTKRLKHNHILVLHRERVLEQTTANSRDVTVLLPISHFDDFMCYRCTLQYFICKWNEHVRIFKKVTEFDKSCIHEEWNLSYPKICLQQQMNRCLYLCQLGFSYERYPHHHHHMFALLLMLDCWPLSTVRTMHSVYRVRTEGYTSQ